VDEVPKSTSATLVTSSPLWWLLGILVACEGGLFFSYKTDIVEAWPLSNWPGSNWEIDRPAVLFWSLPLICFLLLIWREVAKGKDVIVRHLQRLRAFIVCALFGFLLFYYVIRPLPSVMKSGRYYTFALALVALGGLAGIFLCSASETVFMKMPEDPKRADLSVKQSWPRYFRQVILESHAFSRKDPSRANATITMANTALAIGMTVGVGLCINSASPDAGLFTGFGVAIFVYLLGEMLPKQLVLKYTRDQQLAPSGLWLLKAGNFWVRLLSWSIIMPVVSAGIVDTFICVLRDKRK
jgi:hypothetical protein